MALDTTGTNKYLSESCVQQEIRLLPKQAYFLKANNKEILYSGGYGSGKSRVLCYKIVQHAMIPGALIGLFRKERTSLMATTMRTLLESESGLPPVLPPGTYEHNKQNSIIKIKGGGQIYYSGFDSDIKLRSLNLS